MNANKRLFRSRSDRMIAGVSGGIAEYFNIDPTLVRLGFVLLVFTGFFPVAVVGYVAMMLVVPEEGSAPTSRAPMSPAPPAPIQEVVTESDVVEEIELEVEDTAEETDETPAA